MTKEKDLTQIWEALEQNQRCPIAKDLPLLSGLLDEAQVRLRRAWPLVPTQERFKLLTALAELAEADFEMDFSFIFRLGLHDIEASVRAHAIEGLWEDEDPRLIAQFIRLLVDDEAETVRAAAARALGRFVLLGELGKLLPHHFEQTCATLHRVYRNPQESIAVRRRALESIAYTSGAEIATMIEESYRHREEAMRISAVFAMGRNADKRWGKIVLRELENPTPAMRYEAAHACGELELKNAVRPLIEAVEDVDAEVQAAALWALGQIGGPLARRTLERYARSDDEAVLSAANAALNELDFYHGDTSSFFGPPAAFEETLDDETWEEAAENAVTLDESDAELTEDDEIEDNYLAEDEDGEEEDDDPWYA